MPPQLTLIVPVYNGAAHLAEMLDTVAAQTFQDWTCLCINDGSTDQSESIVREYASRDTRFELISKKNGGTGSARNTGLEQVRTPYVMFADQDDWLHPQSFEAAFALIQSSGADIVTFERVRVFGGKYVPARIDVRKLVAQPMAVDFKEQFILGGDKFTCFVWQRIFKAQAIRDVFFPEVSGGEDIVYMYELAYQVKKWAYCDVVLYAIRENPKSTSRTVSSNYVSGFLKVLKELSAAMKKHSVADEVRKSLLMKSFVGFTLVCTLFAGRGKNAKATFAILSNLFAEIDSEEYRASRLSVAQQVVLRALRRRRYGVLIVFAWVFLPYFERDRIFAGLRQRLGLKGAA